MTIQPTLTKTQKYCLIFALALALTLAWTTIARADGPGDLDITFGGTGIVTTSVSSGDDGGFSVAIQPDGKIVVAGVSNSNAPDMAVIRYNGDGSPDTTFNNTGIVILPINTSSWGFATAIQLDGKIVVAGLINSSDTGFSDFDFGVVRYESDGMLDTDFNGTGIVTTNLGSTSDVGRSIAIQPDGKIVVAGDTEAPNGIDHHLAVCAIVALVSQILISTIAVS